MQIAQIQLPIELTTPSVDWSQAKSEFDALVQSEPLEGGIATDFNAIVSGEAGEGEERLERAAAYARRLDTRITADEDGHAFVNGKHFVMDDVSSHCFLH